MLSIGTGQTTRPISAHSATTWGAVEWAIPIIDVLFDGSADSVHYIADQILTDGHYIRLQAPLLRGYDEGQKMVLAEAMWGLVLADGTIAEHEHYLTRKIANLLELHPGYLSQAKKAAAARRTSGEATDG